MQLVTPASAVAQRCEHGFDLLLAGQCTVASCQQAHDGVGQAGEAEFERSAELYSCLVVSLVVYLVAHVAVAGVDVAERGAAVLGEHDYLMSAADNMAVVCIDVGFGCDSDSLV